MKVFIDADEWYPVYSISRDGGFYEFEIEIDPALADRVDAAIVEFDKCQDILSDLFNAAKEAKEARKKK